MRIAWMLLLGVFAVNWAAPGASSAGEDLQKLLDMKREAPAATDIKQIDDQCARFAVREKTSLLQEQRLMGLFCEAGVRKQIHALAFLTLHQPDHRHKGFQVCGDKVKSEISIQSYSAENPGCSAVATGYKPVVISPRELLEWGFALRVDQDGTMALFDHFAKLEGRTISTVDGDSKVLPVFAKQLKLIRQDIDADEVFKDPEYRMHP